MRLGVPYQGSKNAIARQIVSILPSGKRFVDLFAGGCAMTHAAILSGKYERFLANDLHGFGVRLFLDAIAGKCKGRWRQWVSREEFMAKRDCDPLIALCWSFGNNGRTYIYGETIEHEKRRAHEFVIESIDAGKCSESNYKACLRDYVRRKDIRPQVEHVERIQALEALQALERIQCAFQSYNEYKYLEGDIVYCDIPYQSATEDYRFLRSRNITFDHGAFWAWCASRDYPVFVSEYTAPDGFVAIWRKGKCRLMNQNGADGKAVEKVFVAERWAREYQSDMFPEF